MSALGVGLDEAWNRCTVEQLQAYQATFVARYLGEDATGKNLSRAEADELGAAGIAIVSNYEFDPGAARRGFPEGQRVARLADAQHQACGGPRDRPIYFSIDFDAQPADMVIIGQYVAGIASVIGPERTGVYGSYAVIDDMARLGRATWFWQTYAWSKGLWHRRAHIRQVANGIHVAGHNVDRDEAETIDFGQWGVPMLTDQDLDAIAQRVWGFKIGGPANNREAEFALSDLRDMLASNAEASSYDGQQYGIVKDIHEVAAAVLAPHVGDGVDPDVIAAQIVSKLLAGGKIMVTINLPAVAPPAPAQ